MIFRYCITVCLVISLGCAYYIVGYKPYSEYIESCNNSLQSLPALYDEYCSLKKLYEETQKAGLDGTQEKFLQEKTFIPLTIEMLITHAELIGFEKVNIQKHKVKKNDSYKAIFVDLECIGSLQQVIEFFDKIKSNQYTIRYKRISISQQKEGCFMLDCALVLYASEYDKALKYSLSHKSIIPKLCGITRNSQKQYALVACSQGNILVGVGDIFSQFKVVAINKNEVILTRQHSNEEIVLKVE